MKKSKFLSHLVGIEVPTEVWAGIDTDAKENVTADVENQQLSAEESPVQLQFNPELAEEHVAKLKCGNELLVSDAKAAGIILLYVDGFNRSVSKSHVEHLKKSAKDTGFIQPIKVISVEEYLKHYPGRVFSDGDKVFDLSTTYTKIAMVILDGQHRYTADSQLSQENSYKSSLTMEYVDLKGLDPDKWMITINTQSRNWTSKDRTSNILSRNPDQNTSIYLANQWQKIYGMGERAAYAIIELDDCYKKSLQVEYMNNPANGLPPILEGTESKRSRGIKLLHAFEVGFRNYPKMMKNMAAINLSIEIYKAADDKDKESTVKKILLFFMSIDQDVVKKANEVSAIAEKNAILKAEWKKVSKKLSSELSLRATEEESMQSEKKWAEMKTVAEKTIAEKAKKEAQTKKK